MMPTLVSCGSNCGSSSFRSTQSVMVILIGIALAETHGDSSKLPGNLSCSLGSLGDEQTPFEVGWGILATLFTYDIVGHTLGLPGGASSKGPPANAGDTRDAGSIPGLGRSPGGGNGNPLQNSCPENPMDRGAWQAIVHRVAKSWT